MDPSDYRITLRGEMGPRLAAAFAPLEVHAGGGRTVISGVIEDQCHLFGVLQRVRDLGVDLIEVVPRGAGDDDQEGGER
jgi:hypothetical protein